MAHKHIPLIRRIATFVFYGLVTAVALILPTLLVLVFFVNPR